MATGKEKAEAIRHAIDTKLCARVAQKGAVTVLYAMLDAGTHEILSKEERALIREPEVDCAWIGETNSTQERQAIRFMYADFIAHMLESEDEFGDSELEQLSEDCTKWEPYSGE